MAIHVKVGCTKMSNLASWKQTVPELVLNYQLRLCVVQGLCSHHQRARLQTCIAVTKNTQIHQSTIVWRVIGLQSSARFGAFAGLKGLKRSRCSRRGCAL